MPKKGTSTSSSSPKSPKSDHEPSGPNGSGATDGARISSSPRSTWDPDPPWRRTVQRVWLHLRTLELNLKCCAPSTIQRGSPASPHVSSPHARHPGRRSRHHQKAKPTRSPATTTNHRHRRSPESELFESSHSPQPPQQFSSGLYERLRGLSCPARSRVMVWVAAPATAASTSATACFADSACGLRGSGLEAKSELGSTGPPRAVRAE